MTTVVLLTEFDQAELLPGTELKCAYGLLCATGPVYEMALRAPGARLLYTHSACSNVNALASALAGHTVKGDACLLLPGPANTLAAAPSTPGAVGASAASCCFGTGAALVHELLRAGRDERAAEGAAAPRWAASRQSGPSSETGQQQPPPHPQQHQSGACAAAAGTPAPQPPAKSGACVPVGAAGVASRRGAVAQQQRPRCPARQMQQHAAMGAILRGRDAAGGDPVTRQAAGAAGSAGPPSKSARSSGEYGRHGPAAAHPTCARQLPQLQQQHPQQQGALPGAEQDAAAHASWPELESGGGALGTAALGGQGAVEVKRQEQRQPPGWAQVQDQRVDAPRSAACWPAGERPGGEGHVAECADVPWTELPCDVVTCVSMQLPPQASQVLAMAAVCRGWRATLLGHSPELLRRFAFRLDPRNPLRTHSPTAPCGQPRTPAATPRATATAAPAALPAPLGPGCPHHQPHAQPGPLACPDAAAPAADAEAEAESAEARGQDVLGAAMAWQYGAGDFVLLGASRLDAEHHLEHGPEQQQQQQQQQQGGRSAEPHPWAQARAGQMEVDAGGPPQRPVPLDVVRRMPRLLLAAAHAANPTAQLVVAQLLEGSGDESGAVRWWRRLAQGGNPMGLFKMGIACYDGSHGLQSDPELAHMWLGRCVRHILRVDSLAAVALDDHPAPRPLHVQESAPRPAPGRAAHPRAGRVSAAMQAKMRALEPPVLLMLAWSSIVLGYLEFDGVAGRAVWGMGDRSEAVRLFRLAEACGLAEASAVLGSLYNTGQY